jgi:hypothetical protein
VDFQRSENNSLSYPDNGSPLEDASVLRNAVYFSTAQRAYSAEIILGQSLSVNQTNLNFLAVRAFEEFMTSTEDLLGWLFVLEEWQPGTPYNSLFILLDKIGVGKRGRYSEEKAVSTLSSLNGDDFRKLLHIPKDEELIASGISKEFVDNLQRSLSFKLAGWLKLAEERREQDRGRVGMFNKIKHHLLAFPTRERGKNELFIPYNVHVDEKIPAIRMGMGWLTADANTIRQLAGNSIAAQAVLHDTLVVILMTRYAERNYKPPVWVVKAYQQWARSD